MLCPTPHKIAYRSRDEARRSARQTSTHKKSASVAGQLTAYRCPAGDHWHLTHMAAADRKRLKRQQRRRARP